MAVELRTTRSDGWIDWSVPDSQHTTYHSICHSVVSIPEDRYRLHYYTQVLGSLHLHVDLLVYHHHHHHHHHLYQVILHHPVHYHLVIHLLHQL